MIRVNQCQYATRSALSLSDPTYQVLQNMPQLLSLKPPFTPTTSAGKVDTMSVIVPWQQLPADVLNALIEEFVTREGTDYGHKSITTAAKVEQVMRQLRAGTSVITYDARLNSATIIPATSVPNN